MSSVIKVKWKWAGQASLLERLNLEKGGIVQAAIDNAAMSYSMQYAPWRTGTLARSPFTNYEYGSGRFTYEVPYARRMYYNPQYNFRKDVNPLAGAYWFERMKADHSKDILEEAYRVATGK